MPENCLFCKIVRGETTPVHRGKRTSVWQTRITTEDGKPVLVAYQDVDVSKAFTYGLGVAIFMMIGLYLRKLRN